MNAPRIILAAVVAVSLTLLSIDAAGAHDRKSAGALTIVIGWATEPAFSGSLNGVVVSLSDPKGPLAKADGELSVDVSFGNERITLPLERVANRPNEFHALLVPTRAGTYAFHLTGRINNQAIDVSSTCGAGTFHCIEDNTAIQFPVKDPSVGQLAERVDRALPRTNDAGTAATSARTLALIAVVLSIIGVLVAATTFAASRRNAK